ncbi:MAG: aldo/keto reductase [Polyangiaceae bacterium]
MLKRPLGTTGIEISSIVFGGWQSGKEYWVGVDDSDTIAAHRVALEAGITTFDTAEEYGAGHSERVLARALAARRSEIVICTKVSWRHLRREQVLAACENSLKNLGTDVIDLYQIHWPAGTFGSERVSIAETMGALLDLKKQGKIRAIGVSNFSLPQLEEAAAVGRVDAIQPCYSLFFRYFERETLAYCEKNDITVLAYSPLAQGLLTGRFRKGTTFPEGDNRSDNKLFHPPHFDRALQAIDALHPIAARLDITLSQLALAYLTYRPRTAAIAGARNAAQAISNAQAGDLVLSEADWNEVDQIGWTVARPLLDDPMMWTWET